MNRRSVTGMGFHVGFVLAAPADPFANQPSLPANCKLAQPIDVEPLPLGFDPLTLLLEAAATKPGAIVPHLTPEVVARYHDRPADRRCPTARPAGLYQLRGTERTSS